MGTRSRALLLAVTVAVSAACGGQAAAPERGARSARDSPERGGITPALVARPAGAVAVAPSPGATPTRELPATTEFGSPRALLVVDRRGDWLRVALPDRPNGSTGWITGAGVELRELDERVEIDLATRTLTLREGDRVVLTTPVAVGAPDAPTPTGEFYVVDKLSTGDPGHPYGPFAFGLSAHSEAVTEFAGGDGQVGVHGTNDPASIGEAVSHGCIRVPNEVTVELDARLHLGTPVTIE